MIIWKNFVVFKGFVLFINILVYSYSFVLSVWYKSLCIKNFWFFIVVYLIIEEIIEFKVVED